MSFVDLKAMVKPRKIAIIGASERRGSHGRNTYENIVERSNFDKENVYLVNPIRNEIMGRKCYSSIMDIEDNEIDVVIVLVRAEKVPEVLKESACKRIPFALIMSSGFDEIGDAGIKAKKEIEKIVEETGIRVYGPNSPGLTDINNCLGMTFSPAFKYDRLKGSIGLVTQGGGIGRAVLQGQARGIGFGYFFSTGNEMDLELSDFIYYMLNDPRIKVIAAVAEGIKNGEKFIEVAKLALKKKKPIIILKIGRSELGRQAALSHTGSLAGSDEIFDALCNQYGVIRVNDTDELLETSSLFARTKITNNPGISILTGSGGSGSLVADYCGMEGLDLVTFQPSTIEGLKKRLPPFASLNNPVDVTATVLEDRELHEDSLQLLLNDGNVDILIEPLNANYGELSEILSHSLVKMQHRTDKLIVPIWMSSMKGKAYEILEEGGLVPFRSIRNAVLAIKNYISFSNKLMIKEDQFNKKTSEKLTSISASKDKVLNEYESKKIIKKIGISTPEEKLAKSQNEAMEMAKQIGFPVALKIVSKDIPHKTEAGGIRLNVSNEEDVKVAYKGIISNIKTYDPSASIEGLLVSEMMKTSLEMIIGLKKDPQYGMAILIGMGGVQAEVINDVVIGMCPVSPNYARTMINELVSSPLLYGYRNLPKLDVDALVTAIHKLSLLGATEELIAEVDINPLVIHEQGQGVTALDGLIVLE